MADRDYMVYNGGKWEEHDTVKETRYERYDVLCPFCGKDHMVIKTSYLNKTLHHGDKWITKVDYPECDCEWSKIARAMPPLKAMCLNCKYNKGGTCLNKDELNEIKSMISKFDLPVAEGLNIKDVTKVCSHHELDSDMLFNLLFVKQKTINPDKEIWR